MTVVPLLERGGTVVVGYSISSISAGDVDRAQLLETVARQVAGATEGFVYSANDSGTGGELLVELELVDPIGDQRVARIWSDTAVAQVLPQTMRHAIRSGGSEVGYVELANPTIETFGTIAGGGASGGSDGSGGSGSGSTGGDGVAVTEMGLLTGWPQMWRNLAASIDALLSGEPSQAWETVRADAQVNPGPYVISAVGVFLLFTFRDG